MKRTVRKTLLIVGEGETEESFLKYLRSLYCADNQGVAVTVRNAYGKNPWSIINTACKSPGDYDCRAVLMDTDIDWNENTGQLAKKWKIISIKSKPCIEGMLLSILEKPVPEKSDKCKHVIQKLLGIDLTERASYPAHFPRPILEAAQSRMPELDLLLKCFEGKASP